MQKKGATPVIVIIIIAVLVIALIGSGFYINDLLKTKPYIKEISTTPTFIIPTDNNKDSADIFFIIDNPTDIDFSGKIQFIFDQDCFNLWQNEDIMINAKGENSFTRSINSDNYNIPNKCYKTHTIVAKLTNKNSTTIYSSKEFQLTITK
jgi:hypothetical protein